MPRPMDLPCADCGRMMTRYPHSLPAGQARCQPCRDAERPPRAKVSCRDCGESVGGARLPQGEARCKKCRMSVDRKRPNVYCTDCGTWVRYGDHPEDNRASCCHPCRRARAGRGENGRALACEECKAAFYDRNRKRRFCSTRCSGDYQSRTRQVRSADDCRVKRTHREHAAPGLSTKRRSKLLHTWRAQGRTCAYCPRPADTVDHVVPLVRGGTNYEGNLVPACRRCNSSKSGRTVIEWRTGRVLPRMVTNPQWEPKRVKAKPPKATREPRPCAVCQSPTQKRLACSHECAAERNRRCARDRYRASVGLPVNTDEPTKTWTKARGILK